MLHTLRWPLGLIRYSFNAIAFYLDIAGELATGIYEMKLMIMLDMLAKDGL